MSVLILILKEAPVAIKDFNEAIEDLSSAFTEADDEINLSQPCFKKRAALDMLLEEKRLQKELHRIDEFLFNDN